ncbi:MAG: acyltransferase, partial [Hyphomicrobiales bacterium]|nr:acyltransferase [Hyphomicrobiales bacterium]
MSAQSASYRPEIDGLRAFAVLSVVLFHFSVPGLGGGFVGVDIFFVISGFLIGDILWRESAATGRLSLTSFYYRRLKRLAPAFFGVAIVTLAVSYILLLPYEFQEFSKELISSTVYLSNVYFFMKAGYFDTAAEDKLFLHTWSLSVEEQ